MLRSLKSAARKTLMVAGLDVRRARPDPAQRWLRAQGIATVLDIGANTGQFYQDIRRILPDAIVHSFEPLQDCFLELSSAGGRDPHFHAYNFAFGADDGPRQMNRSSFSQSSSLLRMADTHKEAFPHSRHETRVEVEVRRLDDVAPGLAIRPQLLVKIDVQGGESEVISGGETTLASARILIVETSYRTLYEGQPLFADIHDQLGELGFTFQGNMGQLLDPRDGSILQGDSIFLNASPH